MPYSNYNEARAAWVREVHGAFPRYADDAVDSAAYSFSKLKKRIIIEVEFEVIDTTEEPETEPKLLTQ